MEREFLHCGQRSQSMETLSAYLGKEKPAVCIASGIVKENGGKRSQEVNDPEGSMREGKLLLGLLPSLP